MSSEAPGASGPMLLRAASAADLGGICAIYAHHVEHGTGSFETVAPTPRQMGERLQLVLSRGLPWLVADIDGEIAGFAYANWFRERTAFHWTLEDSVYIHPARVGQGLGSQLLGELLRRSEEIGARQMLAVIGDSANRASIALHERNGFRHHGVLESVGWKFGRWLDVVLMQRDLGPGAGEPPAGSSTAG